MKALAIVGLVSLAMAPACASIWGFEDGTLAGDANDPDAASGRDGAGAPDQDATDEDGAGVIPPEAPPPGCEERRPDLGGYFVDRSGSDTNECGEPNSPCKTIAGVFAAYQARFRPVIHLGRADYQESIVLPPVARQVGLIIDGRWEVKFQGATRSWVPDCGTLPTRILATDAKGVRVESIYSIPPPPVEAGATDADAGDAGIADASPTEDDPYDLVLSNVRIVSKSQAAPGETLYGLFATSARVKVIDSAFEVAVGGAGADGASGQAGAPGGTQCSPNTTLGAQATGPAGTPGASAPPTTSGPRFEASGYAADPGEPGEAGGTGSAGGPVSKCLGVNPTAGCGGLGATPGQGGSPGGASIGLYLVGSHLDLVRVTTRVSAGGAGGAGGASATGGDGGQGRTGAGVCSGLNLLPNGSLGGRGGDSGAGAGAAGGSSVCVATVAGSVLSQGEGTTCLRGSSGVGGAGPGAQKAPDGISGDLYTETDGGSQAPP